MFESNIGKRTNRPPYKWQDVYLDKYSIEKPVVLCLSGNGTLNPKRANGLCKLAEHFLKLLFDGREGNIHDYIDVLGFVYTDKSIEGMGTLSDKQCKEIVDGLFIPKCVDSMGNLLPVEQICKNLSKVTFFTFCHGTTIAYIMMQYFSKTLKKVFHMSEDDIDSVLNSMWQISYAPGLKGCTYVPTVFINSLQDSANLLLKENMPFLNGIRLAYDESGMYFGSRSKYARNESINICSSKLRNILKTESNEHYIKILDRNASWESMATDKIKGPYFPGDNADAVSQMLSWALCRAVENGLKNYKSDEYIKKMPLKELFGELQSILNSFEAEDLKEK